MKSNHYHNRMSQKVTHDLNDVEKTFGKGAPFPDKEKILNPVGIEKKNKTAST